VNWFHQNYQWIFSGIGVLAIAFVIQRLFSRRESKHEARSGTKIEDSVLAHSPIATGQNNEQSVATQMFHAENIHIGHAAVVAPAPVHSSKSERPAPNLVYAGARRKDIFVSPWSRDGLCDPHTEEQRKKSIHALVLKVENRVTTDGNKIGHALNVIAKLKFRHKNRVTERDIDYGVWLNSPCNSTDIGVGDTRELVLICVLGEKLVTFEDRRIDSRDFYGEKFSYIHNGDVDGYERVDITLIDQNTQANVTIKLKVWREGDSFCTAEV
jgi:hypothetical protein